MPGTDETANIAAIRAGAIAAAVALASGLGLPSADPRVVSARGNVLVHLAPAPVVARVATLTAGSRRDPAAWLAREVAVAGYVAARALPPGPAAGGDGLGAVRGPAAPGPVRTGGGRNADRGSAGLTRLVLMGLGGERQPT